MCSIQLPGREVRFSEAPFDRVRPLIDALILGVDEYLNKPFALFGHSMGALLIFELARRLRKAGGPQPLRLFASGFRAPQLPVKGPFLHRLSDEELVEQMGHARGQIPERRISREAINLMLPTMRADLALCETYQYRDEPPFTFPITVFGGSGDGTVRLEDLAAWHEHTSSSLSIHLLPGSHFFPLVQTGLLLRFLSRELVDMASAG